MVLKRFGWLDSIVIAILLCSSAFSIPLLTRLQPSNVTIYKDSIIVAKYPLSENKTFNIQGIEGKITISIKDKAVFVKESTCRHQICVRSGAIKQAHGQIVCAPNHIMILIDATKKKTTDVDAISR